MKLCRRMAALVKRVKSEELVDSGMCTTACATLWKLISWANRLLLWQACSGIARCEKRNLRLEICVVAEKFVGNGKIFFVSPELKVGEWHYLGEGSYRLWEKLLKISCYNFFCPWKRQAEIRSNVCKGIFSNKSCLILCYVWYFVKCSTYLLYKIIRVWVIYQNKGDLFVHQFFGK